MVCIPGPVVVPDVSAAVTAATAAATAAQVANETVISVSQKMEGAMEWAVKLAQWGSTKGKWVADASLWIAQHGYNMAHHIKEFTVKRAEFIASMASMAIKFKKFMAIIARFMPIIKVMLIIIMIFTNALKYVIMFIAGICIAILLVIAKILSIPGISYIPAAIYWWFVDFVPFLLFFIIYMTLLLFITVFCALIALLNKICGGALDNLIHCENGPASWYQMVNYHFGNRYDRGLFCSKPCRKGYRPDVTGSFCERSDRLAADYCPQAQVMRIWSGYNRSDKKYAYRDFNDQSNVKYRMKMPEERERMIKDYFLKRKRFFEACDDTMNKYNHVTLGICSNLDLIERKGLYGLDKANIDKLKKVCNQSFCTPDTSYPFCAALANTSKADDDILLKMLVKFGLGIITFIIVFVTLVKITREF